MSNIPSADYEKIKEELKTIEKEWAAMGYKSKLDAIYDLIVRYVYKLKT